MVPNNPDGKDLADEAQGPGGLLVRIASVVVSVSSGAWTTPVPSPSAEIRLSLALISECETRACLSASTCSMKPCPLGQASPQSPTLVLRGSGITIPDGVFNLLTNLCQQQQLWPMAPGAVGWIPDYL